MSITADLVLYNANAITLDKQYPRAELVAIKGNRLLGVGRKDDLELFKGTNTKLIDCQGGTVVPGFNDAHCHLVGLATSLLSVDFRPSAVRSIAELKARIHQRALEIPRGKWVRAWGYHEFYLAERRHPNRWDLDEAAPYHPVKLSHHSGHACVVNSLALKILGISTETSEPPGGVIDRDLQTGEPSGLLFEMNTFVDKMMPPLSDNELERGMALTNQEYLSHGITSLQDATWSDSLGRWQAFLLLKEQGKLIPRISMMIGAEAIEEFQERGLSSGSGDDHLKLGGVKIVLHTTTGSLYPQQEELNQLVYRAHKGGFEVALHCVEEETVEAAIVALEYALNQTPKPHRHRLEHCSVCPPRLMQRLKRIQPIIVTQPSFIYYSGERYLATVPPDDLKWLYRIGSLHRSGLTVAASSDSPVVPLDPLVGIYAAITRATQNNQVILPHEGVLPLEAVEMYTLGGAYACGEEEAKGSVAPDKLADLVVLSNDPTKVDPHQIMDIKVMMTIVDGKVVWQR